jgi:hypothetical protein
MRVSPAGRKTGKGRAIVVLLALLTSMFVAVVGRQ